MSAVKILITSQKGGVGKSTISANLAAYFSDVKFKRVTLIDFDHQATASYWMKRCISRAAIRVCDALSYKSSGLSLLKAKEELRIASAASDIVIADLTWVDIFPASFFFDYDLIIIPSSLSGIELASATDFLTRFAPVFNSCNLHTPQIILMPNRLLDINNYRTFFNNCGFPVPFSLTSPIMFSKPAQESFGETYFFKSGDSALKDSFLVVCKEIEELVSDLVVRKNKKMQTLTGVASITRSNGGGLLDKFIASRNAVRKEEAVPAPRMKTAHKWFGFLKR